MIQSNVRAAVKEFLQIVFHRKWLFVIPFVGISVIVAISGFLMPKIYMSSNLILVEQVRAKNPLVTGLAVATTVKGHMGTLRQEIVSRTRLIRVIKTLGLDRSLKDERALMGLVRSLQKNITVNLAGNNLVRISCKGRDPRTIKKIVDTTTKFFIEKNLELESREVETAIKFIQSQLDVYKKKLDDAQAVLKNFRQVNMLDINASPGEKITQLLGLSAVTNGGGLNAPVPQEMVTEGSNVNINRVLDFQNQLLQLEVSLNEALEEKHMLEKQLEGQTETIVSEVIKESSPVVKKLREEEMGLELELSGLLVNATENHPRVIDIRRRLLMIKTRIEEEAELITTREMSAVNPLYQEAKKNLNNIELRLKSLQAKKNSIEKLTRLYEQKIKDLPERELERVDIMREYQIASSMYSSLLGRLETARITKRLEVLEKGSTFEVLDAAKVPIEPVSPNKLLITILGLMLGAFAGAGLVFLAEYADSSFRGVEDARTFFKEPVLGSVSQILTVEEVVLQKKNTTRIQVTGMLVFIGILGLVYAYFKL